MATMLDGAHFEALAAVAFVSASPPPAFGHLLAAADRGVQVRLLIRADNLAGGLVQSLQSRGVDLGTLTDLHAKFLITDTTAMNGSANFTEASADRASEVATFFSPHTRPSCTICASCSTTTGSGRDPTDTALANHRTRVSRAPSGNALTLRCNGRRKVWARALHDTPPSTGPKRATHAESGIRHRADRPACDEDLSARPARERWRHLTADDSG